MEMPQWGKGAYTAEKVLELIKDKHVLSALFHWRLDQEMTVKKKQDHFIVNNAVPNLRRIINLAYLVALCRWKQLDMTKNGTPDGGESWGTSRDIESFNNARFSRMFRGAVLNEEVTLDLQIFSLNELWIGLRNNNTTTLVSSCFANIFDNSIEGNTIGLTLKQARDLIKTVEAKGSLESGINAKCNEVTYRLLKSFVVFQGMSIEYDAKASWEATDDFVIRYSGAGFRPIELYPNRYYSAGKLVALYEQLARREYGETDMNKYISLYMLTGTAAFNEETECTYRSFDDEDEVCFKLGSAKRETGGESGEYVREMRKFLSFNYEDIRDIALVISDSLRKISSKKKVLFNICKTKYPKIIADVKDENAPSIYWDNIVTLMLVEMGKRDFLEQILDDEDLFKEIRDNIIWRQEQSSEIFQKYDDALREIDQNVMREDQKTLYKIQLKAKTVLQCFTRTQDDDLWRYCPYAENLSDKYTNILSCISVLKQCQAGDADWRCDGTEKIKELKEIFRNIFIFLRMFYEALDEYAKKVHSPESNEEQLQAAFESEANKVLTEIKDCTLTEAFEGFCKVCEEYTSYPLIANSTGKEKVKRLKSLITRSCICDVKKLRFFAETTMPKPQILLHKVGPNNELIPENYTIFEILDGLLYGGEFINADDLPVWLGQFLDLFLFLIYNEDYNQKGLYKARDEAGNPIEFKDKDCDPIYPYIVTYYKENRDRDQLKKCTYGVPIPTNGRAVSGRDSGFVVTLLTDKDYKQDTYFCIPLRYGSSDSWWINPFLYPVESVRKAYLKAYSKQKED